MPFEKLWDAPRPRWATDDTFWLAFYCPYPNFDGFLAPLRFRRSEIPLEQEETPDIYGNVNWRLDVTVARQWGEIASVFAHLGRALTSYRTIVTGTLPPLTGYFENPRRPDVLRQTFMFLKDARSKLANARLNLIVWMAEISYLISLRPHWEEELAQHISSRWLADIRRSCIADRAILRQGIFIDVRASSSQWMSLLPHLFNYKGMPIFLSYGSQIPAYFANDLLKQYAPLRSFIDFCEWRRRNPSYPRRACSQEDFLLWLQTHESPAMVDRPSLPSSTEPQLADPSQQIEWRGEESSGLDLDAPRLPEGSRQKQGQHPSDFFQEQRISLERCIARESLGQKVVREARERSQNALPFPTLRGPPVFVWIPETLNNKTYWVRTICGANRRDELRGTTSRAMRIYHSVINEWDVWPGLDPDWVDDADEQLDEDGGAIGLLQGRTAQPLEQINVQSSSQVMNPRRRSTSPLHGTRPPVKRARSPLPRHRDLPLLLSRDEMEQLYRSQLGNVDTSLPRGIGTDTSASVFTYRYGLLIDPAYTPGPPSAREINEASVGRIWSFHRLRDDIPQDWYPYLLDFTSQILAQRPLPSLLTSLAAGARHPDRSRLSPVRVTNTLIDPHAEPRDDHEDEKMYLVEGIGSDDLPWTLVVPSATTAAQILRSSWGPDKQSITEGLLHRGIRFHIMLPSKPPLHKRRHPQADNGGVRGGLGWRKPGFIANSFDYLQYEHYCGSFFQNHAYARAALSSGGILWRLAIQYLDCQLVLDGPVGDYEHQLDWIINGREYVGDLLEASDQDLISGVYKVLNGAYLKRQGQESVPFSQ